MTARAVPFSQWLADARADLATARTAAEFLPQVQPGPLPARLAQARLLAAAANRNASHRQANPDPKEASDG